MWTLHMFAQMCSERRGDDDSCSPSVTRPWQMRPPPAYSKTIGGRLLFRDTPAIAPDVAYNGSLVIGRTTFLYWACHAMREGGEKGGMRSL
jgi:hypothetical protein